MSRFLLGLILFSVLFSFGLNEFADAKGADEPCSYLDKNHYHKYSYDSVKGTASCVKVDYWVPERCGNIAGLYLTDSACQPPKPVEQTSTDEQQQREQQQREQQQREQQQREQQQREQQQREQQYSPQPTPSVEKYSNNYNSYCTPSSVSFDSSVSNSFLLKIGNPDSFSCKYSASLYDLDRTKIKDLGTVTKAASLNIGESIPEGNYMLLVKTINGDYSKFFPLSVDHPNRLNPINDDKITTPIDHTIILIVIPIIAISIIAVIIKSKKSRGSTRTQTGSSYSSTSKKQKTSKKTSSSYSSSPDYFRWTNCCACGKKFSRFNMKKTTSDSYENVPAGEYICNRCSSIYRKVDRINKGIYKESTLRDFRQRQEYITLEHNSRREKVTTDEEFDELISELEFGARDEWEFSTLEKLILDSILLEFYQRKQAHTRTDEQSEQKQRPGNDEYIKSLEILGLSKDSTFDEIKKRHRELVLVHHPDRNPDPERKKFSEHMMKEINKAMDVIRRIREK
jgi:hypothetical protein